jgi:hypothetical protein
MTRDVLIWEAYSGEQWYTIATAVELAGVLNHMPLVLRDQELAVAAGNIARQHATATREQVRLMRYVPAEALEVVEPPAYTA